VRADLLEPQPIMPNSAALLIKTGTVFLIGPSDGFLYSDRMISGPGRTKPAQVAI